MSKVVKPIHPGEILKDEFLHHLKISQNKLAMNISVPPNRINQICNGARSITADTAIRLAKYFGTSAEFWMNLQIQYDLDVARLKAGVSLDSIIPGWQV